MSDIIRFNDLSDEEKLKLTDEQVTDFVKIECAFDGVKVLPYPVEPEAPPMGDKKEYWRIGYHSDLTFLKKEEAEAVMSLLKQSDMIETNYQGDIHYITRIHKFSNNLNTDFYHTKEQYEAMKIELEQYNTKKKNYDALEKEYTKAQKSYRAIEDEIWDKIQIIRELNSLKEDITKTYLEYLSIAKGNQEIAMGFLHKAYKEDLGKLEKGIGKTKLVAFQKELVLLELPKRDEFNPLIA